MEEVLEVHCQPYDPQVPQVCLDEKPLQFIKQTRTPLPAEPGQPERVDYEYERNGTANLFLFVEPLGGRRHVAVTERRTRLDWAGQIRDLVDVQYPQAQRIRLVMDTLNTHTLGSLYDAFKPAKAQRIAQRLAIHYTPKHGSWLNRAELELSALTRQCLTRRIPDLETLRQETQAWEQTRNERQSGIDWRFTTADARIKLKRLYPQIQT